LFDAWLRFARNVSVDGCRGSFGRFQKGGWHFLGVLFDARQSAREKELKQLEDQLVKLKAAQSKRTAQKERIVKDRVQQLINNADGIGWGGDSPSEGSFQFQAEPMNVEGQFLQLLPRYAPVPDATSPSAASSILNRP